MPARCLYLTVLLGLASCSSPQPGIEVPSPPPAQNAGQLGSLLPDGSLPQQPDLAALQLNREDIARWEAHPGKAMAKARALDRPLLLLFTALDWSTNARLLGEEVFLSAEFNQLARDNLSLVYIDFPRNQSQAPESARKLKQKFQVKGFPTLLLLDHQGIEIHRQTGYVTGSRESYLEELSAAIPTRAVAATRPLNALAY